MQLISALFDAPVPAGMALAALAEAEVAPDDLGVWPSLPPLALPPPAAGPRAELGLPDEGLEQAREGLARGAILVLARAPDLRAADLAARLAACGPLGPEAPFSWQHRRDLRYPWAELGWTEPPKSVEVAAPVAAPVTADPPGPEPSTAPEAPDPARPDPFSGPSSEPPP
jgi:hypothetical protein